MSIDFSVPMVISVFIAALLDRTVEVDLSLFPYRVASVLAFVFVSFRVKWILVVLNVCCFSVGQGELV